MASATAEAVPPGVLPPGEPPPLPLTPPDSPLASSDDDDDGVLIASPSSQSRLYVGDSDPSVVTRSACGARLAVRHGGNFPADDDGESAASPPLVMHPKGAGGAAPLPRSALKKCSRGGGEGGCRKIGRNGKERRVTINEAQNEVVEADYVIVVEETALSPPDGYKDAFGRPYKNDEDFAANHSGTSEEITADDYSGSECMMGREPPDLQQWIITHHKPACPRANLPDLVVSQQQRSKPHLSADSGSLTVENVRNHDHIMEGFVPGNEAPAGILKGGKLWRRVDKRDRCVRFSGRDEYAILDTPAPHMSAARSDADEAAIACFLAAPKFRELGNLLGGNFHHQAPKHEDDWIIKFNDIRQSGSNVDLLNQISQMNHHPTCARHSAGQSHIMLSPAHPNETPLEDEEHIGESVQRYDEMLRRRIAATEGRENGSICSDVSSSGSKTSSDSQVSDLAAALAAAEARVRRLEKDNASAGGAVVLRSNSEVRRAIERNALRRSLMRFAEARKKDTNRNDSKSMADRQEAATSSSSSLIDRLKWLTASEDATNGNAERDDSSEKEEIAPALYDTPATPPPVARSPPPDASADVTDGENIRPRNEGQRISCTIEQYRKLADMFNRTTSFRSGENGEQMAAPCDERDWKLDTDIFTSSCDSALVNEGDFAEELPPGSLLTFTAVPATVSETEADEDVDKLIYSGGIRYTKEGTLPYPQNRRQRSLRVASESYSTNDIDEALHDDRSSSLTSSQSSPRMASTTMRSDGSANRSSGSGGILTGMTELDIVSAAESGYSSNETNSDLGHVLPPELDELAEFVRRDTGRIERLRRRYDDGSEDHGFCRRPSVRGIRPRFTSTSDLLKQMASQITPPAAAFPPPQQLPTSSSLYYENKEENDKSSLRRRQVSTVVPRMVPTMPFLQEDIPYTSKSNGDQTSRAGVYSHPSASEHHRIINTAPPQRTQSYSSLPQFSEPINVTESALSIITNSESDDFQDLHHPACNSSMSSRRSASVHGHVPTDALVCTTHYSMASENGPTGQYYSSIKQQQQESSFAYVPHNDLSYTLTSHNPYTSGPQQHSSNSKGLYESGTLQYQHNHCSVSPENSDTPLTYHGANCGRENASRSGYSWKNNASAAPPPPPPPHFGNHAQQTQHQYQQQPTLVPQPIISSHSYTTPIVPEVPSAKETGVFIKKVDFERGVPEGASAPPKMVMDPFRHYHQPPPMNVPT